MGAAQGWPRRSRKKASSRGDGMVRVGVGVRLKEAQEQETERGQRKHQTTPLPPLRPRPGASEPPLPGELLGRLAWLASLPWNGDAEEEAFRVTGPAETGKCGRVLSSPLVSARPD